jgi:DhnA family fructose-bisphosphate aldolase class Ia
MVPLSGGTAAYLASPDSYHNAVKNCRSDLVIRTGWSQDHEEAFLVVLIALAEAGLMCLYGTDM